MKTPRVWVIEKFSRGAWRPTGNAFLTKSAAEAVCSMKRDDVVKYRLKLYYGITDPYKDKKWLEIQQKAKNLRYAVETLLDFDFSEQGVWDPHFVSARDRFKSARILVKRTKITGKYSKKAEKSEKEQKSRASRRAGNNGLAKPAPNTNPQNELFPGRVLGGKRAEWDKRKYYE
jgi:hypothetical protein